MLELGRVEIDLTLTTIVMPHAQTDGPPQGFDTPTKTPTAPFGVERTSDVVGEFNQASN